MIAVAVTLIIAAAGVAAVYFNSSFEVEAVRARVASDLELAKLKRLDEEAEARVMAEVERLRAAHDETARKVANLQTRKAFGG